MIKLGCNHDFITRRKLAQQSTGDLLGHPGRVHVGGVEQVDPKLDRTLHDRACGFFTENPRPPLWGTEGHHAERNARHLETALAQIDVMHRNYPSPSKRPIRVR